MTAPTKEVKQEKEKKGFFARFFDKKSSEKIKESSP